MATALTTGVPTPTCVIGGEFYETVKNPLTKKILIMVQAAMGNEAFTTHVPRNLAPDEDPELGATRHVQFTNGRPTHVLLGSS